MIKRRIVQIISLLILHSSWGPEAKFICNPVLSCHSCVLSWFACPIGAYVHYSGWSLFPFFAIGSVLLLGVLFGRLLCGWVCPFGFLQDMLYKIPSPKFVLPKWTYSIKYIVLVVMVLLVPFLFGADSWYSFCRICPSASLQARIPNLIAAGSPPDTLIKIVPLVLLALVILAAIFSSRAFCNVVCPIGAILGPLNLISWWKVKPPVEGCIDCGLCDTVCTAHDRPSRRTTRGRAMSDSTDCLLCHDCKVKCPVHQKTTRKRRIKDSKK